MGAPRIDDLASLARTALDDPNGLVEFADGVEATSQFRGPSYAVDRLDEIINLLNPSEWTRATATTALRTLGLHLNEVMEGLSGIAVRLADSGRSAMAEELAGAAVDQALDSIDSAVRSLEAEEAEDDAGAPDGFETERDYREWHADDRRNANEEPPFPKRPPLAPFFKPRLEE